MQSIKYQLDLSANYLNEIESKKLNHYRDFKPRIWSSRQQLFDILKIDKVIQESSQEINYQHIKFKQGNKVCLSGEECNYLYVVYSGFLKSSWSDSLGIEKVLNFPMRGDIIGLDGMLENKYKNDVVALSDIELIMIPNNINKFKDVDDLLIVKKIIETLSKELIDAQKMEFIIGALPAEARVAKFLLSLGRKYEHLGFSANAFNLKMTRNDIGSYLGLTLETVSRTLSELNRAGIVKIDQRLVQIYDVSKLLKLRRITIRKKIMN